MTVDVAEGWGRIRAATSQPSTPKWKHYRPLTDAVNTYVQEAQDGERIYLGIPEFDQQIRGVGKSHLLIINGYSHSGKTLVEQHIIRHNKHKRIAAFTPDEPAQLLLAKLASAEFGVSADLIEERVAAGDQEMIDLLTRTATEVFPNLIVFDKPLRGEDMEAALAEAEDVWQAKADCYMLDYLELLQAGETVPQKADFVKGFGSRHELAGIVLHQTSRSAGAEGKRMTISSGSFGGEQHATYQLGVWRKQAEIASQLIEINDKMARAQNGATESQVEKREALEHELQRARYTLTVAITKNKRPGRREGREEIDFELYGETGIIRPLEPAELPEQHRRQLERERAHRMQTIETKQPEYDEPSFDEEPF